MAVVLAGEQELARLEWRLVLAEAQRSAAAVYVREEAIPVVAG